MKEVREKELQITDVLLERPHGFYVGDHLFYLFPVSLGKMLLTQEIYKRLGINETAIKVNATVEALRVAKEKREDLLLLISYHTCRTKKEIYNTTLIDERVQYFSKELDEKDIATLLLIILTDEKTGLFIKQLGIEKEQERLSMVLRLKSKENKNSLTFGGKTIYGSLIDIACERYGWTFDYVLWGISYTNLRLLLADKVNDVYLTDDERKKLPAHIRSKDEEIIRPTKENMARIKAMDWK